MLKSRFKKFLSFLCCICFISSFMCDLTCNIVRAATSGTINVSGYSSIEDGSTYKYEGGTMTISYTSNGNTTTCNESSNTNVPIGATLTFVLEPQSGFTPSLKINRMKQRLNQGDNGQYTYTLTMPDSDEVGVSEIDVEAAFSSETENEKNIVISLKYAENEELKNGTYNDDFKSRWATIEYSSDGGTTYAQLNQGTNLNEEGAYIFDESIDSVNIRLTWEGKIIAVIDTDLVESGENVSLGKGSHVITFQDAVYTVIWLYEPQPDIDEFAITKHGKVAIEKGEGIEGQEDATGGIYAIPPGTQVTMHFIPDYGYQFKENTIGENLEITPQSDECTYTFTMPEDFVIIGNIFTENPDVVNISVNSIVSANILNASDIIPSGNAELTVVDSLMTQETKSKVISDASENNLTPITYFSMELNKFLTKGATGEKWETMISTTDSPAKITLTLNDDLRGRDSYAVIRVDENEVTYLNTTYDKSNGTIQFETDKFSQQYAVCVSSNSGAVISAGKTLTGDHNKVLLYSLIALAAVLGFIYTFKLSKKNKSKM